MVNPIRVGSHRLNIERDPLTKPITFSGKGGRVFSVKSPGDLKKLDHAIGVIAIKAKMITEQKETMPTQDSTTELEIKKHQLIIIKQYLHLQKNILNQKDDKELINTLTSWIQKIEKIEVFIQNHIGNLQQPIETRKPDPLPKPSLPPTVAEATLSKEQLVKSDISELKKNKNYNIKKAKNLNQVVKEVKEIYKRIKTDAKVDQELHTLDRTKLGFEGTILSFARKGKQPKSYVLLGEKVNGLLGKGAYKKVFLGASLGSSSKLVAISLQKDILGSDPKELIQRREGLKKEHEVGKALQDAIGSKHIHTTKLISEFKEPGEKKSGEVSRIALVSDLCVGSYEGVMKGEIEIKPKKVMDDFKNLLKTLHKVHEQGYVHFDIKGDNIFLDTKLNPKFADWGEAKSIEEINNKQSNFENFEEACAFDVVNLVTAFSSLIWSKPEYEALKAEFTSYCHKNNIVFIPSGKQNEFNENFYAGFKPVCIKCNYQDLVDQTVNFTSDKQRNNLFTNAFIKISELHRKGIAYNELKPEHILVTASNNIVIPEPESSGMVKKGDKEFENLCKKNMEDLARMIKNELLPPGNEEMFKKLCIKYQISL